MCDEKENDAEALFCVNCMNVTDSLYTMYSRDVIRITECKHCLKPVDRYVEFDVVLVFIDLILQYSTAYRHLLLNTKFRQYGRLALLFFLCDAYDKWIERRAVELSDTKGIYQIETQFYQSLVQSIVEMLSYTLAIYAVLCACGQAVRAKCGTHKSLMFAFVTTTLMGFYGNIFVVFSIIWKLHHHWSYRLLTQFFLLISHVQVQRTLLPSLHWAANCGIVACGLLAQLLAGQLARYALESLGRSSFEPA